MTASTNANRNHRNQRNNPYITDSLAVRLHRSGWGVAWRWRTEIIILTAATAATVRLSRTLTLTWTGIILAAAVLVLLALPWTRRYLTRRFWCILARHRIQKLCYEARLHTRAGRLPLVLWTRPTKVGERAWLLCRAGICAEDFEAHAGEIAAACYARQARISVSKRRAQLVTLDIVRRDTLAPHNVITSGLHKGWSVERPDSAA